MAEMLEAANFVRLHETEPWGLTPGGKYFTVRDDSGLMAWTVGGAFNPKTAVCKILAGHTDSPCIRLAPKSAMDNKGWHQTAIQTYGAGIWTTWMDKDLKLSGRVLVRQNGKLESRLYDSVRPVASIPNLCVHFGVNRPLTIEINKETHLRAVISTSLYDQLNPNPDQASNHFWGLMQDIGEKLKVAHEDIVDFDLCFADTEPGCFFGFNDEFISSGRLANLYTCYFTLVALMNASEGDKLANKDDICFAGLFDHESIGSKTVTGADSEFCSGLIKKIFALLAEKHSECRPDQMECFLRKSFLLNGDMAHAVHPCWPGKTHSNHQAMCDKGVVVKYDANQGDFITNSISGSMVKEVLRRADVPMQDFVNKQDAAFRGTIGPLLAGSLGCLAADVGIAQLATGSIREMCGVLDAYYYLKFFECYYENPLPVVTTPGPAL